MLNKKFSDIFSKQKQKQKAKTNNVYFNQSIFECKLAYHPHKLSLIKVNAQITVGKDAGMPLMIKCRWFINRDKKYSQIQGVTSGCYQPCIDDVGCSICVQIEPIIQGKIYTGAFITKETGPLELGITFQTDFNEMKNNLFHKNIPAKFRAKLQSGRGMGLEEAEQRFRQQIQLEIKKQEDYNFDISLSGQLIKTCYWITQSYPQADFIRKSYNSILLKLNANDEVRLAFDENIDREMFGMLIKTLVASSTVLDEVDQQQQFEGIPQRQNKTVEEINDPISYQEKNQVQNPQTVQASNPKEHPNLQENSNQSDQKDSVQKPEIALSSEQLSQEKDRSGQQMDAQSLPIISHEEDGLRKKISEMSGQLKRAKEEHNNLLKKVNMERIKWRKGEEERKKMELKWQDSKKLEEEYKALLEKLGKIGQSNRFYKNEISLLKKELKKSQYQTKILSEQYNLLKTQIQTSSPPKTTTQEQHTLSEIHHRDLIIKQLTEANQILKTKLQTKQDELVASHKKIESLSMEKSIKEIQIKSEQCIPMGENLREALKRKDKLIGNLEFKVANLENILKHRAGERGNQVLGLQKVINSMTETITEKDEQIDSLKRINKELIHKLQNPY